VDRLINGSGPVSDIDPPRWANPASTYDDVAAAYAATFLHELDHKPFDREILTRFAAATRDGSQGGHPVCDLGCGPGHIGAFLAANGVDVVGIDLSAGMVAQARLSYPTLSFSQGDMTALALPDSTFAGIACFYALIHVPRSRVATALLEMARVLVPGGALLVAVHGGRGTLHADEMVGQRADLDVTLFSLAELCELMQRAGFAITEARERAPYEVEHPTPRLYVWATAAP
jgi:ubiquinone/menaquinone biosynthesis C-methylase UbiE